MAEFGMGVRAAGAAVLLACAVPAGAQGLSWVAYQGRVPADAIIGGQEPARQLPVCRARHGQGGNIGVHPGKLVAGKCNIGWGGREVELTQFEVLTGDPRHVTWLPAVGGVIPPGAFVGGEEPGRKLIVCRAPFGQGGNIGVHPGKLVAGKCNIGWGGREHALVAYQVMVGVTPATSTRDVTAKLETLGTPLQAKYPSGDRVYARNVWAMHAFGGRMFIGSGNSNNDPPAKNAGPVDVYAYDPPSNRFVKETTLQDEQIDVFRVIGGQLVIPGHDPVDSVKNGDMPWFKGNFYRRRPGGGWETLRTLPLAVHNYDMTVFGNRLFAAGSTATGGVVLVSHDNGKSWSRALSMGGPWSRARSFFVAGGVLHVSALVFDAKNVGTMILGKVFSSVKSEAKGKVYALSGGSFREIKTDFFPGDGRSDLFVARPVSFRNHAVYIGADALIDHDWRPAGLYAANASSSVRRLALPGNALARDLKVEGDTLYVLAWRGGLVEVYATTDLSRWAEVLAFQSPTFARSFGILNGDFYFGLGSEPSPLHGAAGRILRVKAADVPKG